MNEGGGEQERGRKGDREEEEEEEEEESRGQILRIRERTDFESNQYEKYFIFS